jgi:UDP-N-acetylmuramoyl-tripeptide--D-alanyl-D-alanine ligase
LKETISSLYNLFLESEGICTDTRVLKKNQLFFALKGDNFNGNGYAKHAIENGACCAIIDEEEFNIGENYFLVKDVLSTLQELAIHHRDQFDIPFLGIVGSNGKTTTKELIACAMHTDRKIHFTPGNLNNHIGVPLTLLSMPLDTTFAIIEMGANHIGEIEALCAISQPTHGVITNIGHAHIGEFGGRDAIIRAKSELFDYLRKTDGVPFINLEDKVLNNMSKRFSNGVSYPNALCELESLSPFIRYKDNQGTMHQTSMFGSYNFLNISAAITVSKYFNVADPYTPIDQYIADNNRSEVIHLASNTVILDAYNANLDSMQLALQSLDQMKGKSKVAILGDMKELGEYSIDQHQSIIELAISLNFEKVILVGSDFKTSMGNIASNNAITTFENLKTLFAHLEINKISQSTVLIKGSRSMKMELLTKQASIWN